MFGIGAIIIAFLILGILIYKKIDFGYSIIIASAVLLILSNPSIEAYYWLIDISTEYETLELVSIIILIGFLGFLYKDSGQVVRMIKELRGAVPDRRLVLASIPAIFGLMPMPGGALVSAPMIDDEGDALDVSNVHKTFMNWWFRHIWFTVYPLSLGLILASTLSGISLYKIALFNIPIFSVQIITGMIWGVKRIKPVTEKEHSINPLLLIWELFPIIIALSLNIVFGLPFYITLLIAVIFLLIQNREEYDWNDLLSLTKKGFSFDLLLASYGIMLFKGIIERSNSISPTVAALQNYIPLLAVIIVVAVVIGLSFGHLPGAIGVGFPVLLTILPVINVQTIGLIFLFIFLGYLISPIHLCIILTIEYFNTTLVSFYKRIVSPFIIVVIVTVA